jgi:predicted Co/Zn/Cd cation transporter (cation efflux family)
MGASERTQLVLALAARAMHKRNVRFPAGRTRLEPIAICINAVSMIALSLEVITGTKPCVSSHPAPSRT